MSDVLATLNEYIWSNALVYLCLAAGLYFTIATGLVQLRRIPDMIRLVFRGKPSDDGISSFQALAMSLAGRVGTGNIAGVATAIAFGGPGAVFWMWLVAFFGASTSFVECTLGQIYKERDPLTGEYRGGPAYYFKAALAHTKAAPVAKVWAYVFAIVTVVSCGFLLPNIQANSISESVSNTWDIPKWVVGAVTMLLLAFIVIGGVKRIATFAGIIVPFMAVAYILIAIVILIVNAGEVPGVIKMIFESAFGGGAVFGGLLGSAIMWGVKRGIYSNEAGQGTGPHFAAAAEVSHPAKQGLVQSMSVYIDTLLVCSATAFLILSTGAYRVFYGVSAAGTGLADGGILPSDVSVGAAYAQHGFDTLWSGAGGAFVAISLAFFCFTTIVAYYYMAETNLRFILGEAAKTYIRPLRSTLGANLTLLLQFLILGAVLWGAVSTAEDAWAMGDVGVGAMAWLNIVGILVLQIPAIRALRDYDRQRKQGLDPVFDPVPLGIKGATFWETYDPKHPPSHGEVFPVPSPPDPEGDGVGVTHK